MTKVTLFTDEKDLYCGLETSGHAFFASYGKDIVCSAVSALVINFINSVDELTSSAINVDMNQDEGYIKAVVSDYDKPDVQLLFKSLKLGVTEISKEYSKNVKLTNRRCTP